MSVNNTQKYLNDIEERETCFGHFQKNEAGFWQSLNICTVFPGSEKKGSDGT